MHGVPAVKRSCTRYLQPQRSLWTTTGFTAACLIASCAAEDEYGIAPDAIVAKDAQARSLEYFQASTEQQTALDRVVLVRHASHPAVYPYYPLPCQRNTGAIQDPEALSTGTVVARGEDGMLLVLGNGQRMAGQEACNRTTVGFRYRREHADETGATIGERILWAQCHRLLARVAHPDANVDHPDFSLFVVPDPWTQPRTVQRVSIDDVYLRTTNNKSLPAHTSTVSVPSAGPGFQYLLKPVLIAGFLDRSPVRLSSGVIHLSPHVRKGGVFDEYSPGTRVNGTNIEVVASYAGAPVFDAEPGQLGGPHRVVGVLNAQSVDRSNICGSGRVRAVSPLGQAIPVIQAFEEKREVLLMNNDRGWEIPLGGPKNGDPFPRYLASETSTTGVHVASVFIELCVEHPQTSRLQLDLVDQLVVRDENEGVAQDYGVLWWVHNNISAQLFETDSNPRCTHSFFAQSIDVSQHPRIRGELHFNVFDRNHIEDSSSVRGLSASQARRTTGRVHWARLTITPSATGTATQ